MVIQGQRHKLYFKDRICDLFFLPARENRRYTGVFIGALEWIAFYMTAALRIRHGTDEVWKFSLKYYYFMDFIAIIVIGISSHPALLLLK